jgi:hypothetical protein
MNVGKLMDVLKLAARTETVYIVDQHANVLDVQSIDLENPPDEEGDRCVNIHVEAVED